MNEWKMLNSNSTEVMKEKRNYKKASEVTPFDGS